MGQFDGRRAVGSWDKDPLADYAREYGRVLNRYFARRGAAPEICEDLVQDVFARLSVLTQKKEIKNGEAYLMRTASSVWIDFLRKKQKKSEHTCFEYDDCLHSPEGISPERVLEGKQALDAVVDVLASLPPRTRQAYLLCRIEGYSRKDVAAKLRITVSGVDKHLITAAKKIGLTVKDEE